jgi:sterol desaturase/sphingolipid hydroxylase (fatty acid hydroxylase superfamily)
METTAYYAFGVPLYAGLIAAEFLLARRRGAPTLPFAPSFGNLSAGLGTIVFGLFLGPALILLYEAALGRVALVRWPEGSLVPWILALVLADFGHYWHHRLEHRVAACWAVHGVHHMPEEMNFTVAMRLAWFSDLYSFPFYAPLPLLGVPTAHFFVASTVLSLHALFTHTEYLRFPSLGFLVTPRSHTLHHARNPIYLDKNFGAALCIWDRLFGTYVDIDPEHPPEYGTVRGYATHDGVRAQFVLWADLVALARQAPTLRDKLRVVFGPPDRLPPGATAPVLVPPRPSASIPLRTKLYVAAQAAVTIPFALYVFVLRDAHSWALKGAGAAAILACLFTLGGLLDGRRGAWRWEGMRMAATAALIAVWIWR